jgi:hypothetical protein
MPIGEVVLRIYKKIKKDSVSQNVERQMDQYIGDYNSGVVVEERWL